MQQFWNEDGSDVWDFNGEIFSKDVFSDFDILENKNSVVPISDTNASEKMVIKVPNIESDINFLKCNEKVPIPRIGVFPLRYLDPGEYIELYEPDVTSFVHDVRTIYAMVEKPNSFDGNQKKTQRWLNWRDYKTKKSDDTYLHVFKIKNNCQPGKPRLRLSLMYICNNWFRYRVSKVKPTDIRKSHKKRKIDDDFK